MPDRISVILVDDHPMVLQGISACIYDALGMDLVGHASDAGTLMVLPELAACDVLILDINLPGINGLELLPRVLEKNERIKVLVFSMHRGVEYARKALAAGASGYVFKDAMPDELIAAVQIVHRGGTYLPTETAAALASGVVASAATSGSKMLTDRELQVLTEVAAGQSSKSIAWKMGLSVRTIETHRQNIKQKLGAKSASECVSIAMGYGLIS